MPEDLLTRSAKEVDRAGLIRRVLEGRLAGEGRRDDGTDGAAGAAHVPRLRAPGASRPDLRKAR